MEPTLNFNLFDAASGDEIEGVTFGGLLVKPSVGDELHYWQDGTSERAWEDSGIRRDFRVDRVVHDLRYMPPRSGGNGRSIHMLAIYVTELLDSVKITD